MFLMTRLLNQYFVCYCNNIFKMSVIGSKSGSTFGQPHAHLGAKSHSVSTIGGKSASHGNRRGRISSVVTIPQYTGRGDLGNGNLNKIGGNTNNSLGNAQRDAAPRPFNRDELLKRPSQGATLESKKKNKRA